jgi:hypothetical protein
MSHLLRKVVEVKLKKKNKQMLDMQKKKVPFNEEFMA